MSTTSTDRRNGVNIGSAVKVPCRAATTANITLSGEQSIDGVSCVTGDRVLVKDQTDGTENGIYVCDTGPWNRDKDWDGAGEIKKGTLVFVHSGTTNQGWWYVSTADPITIGTTSVTIAAASTALAVISAFMQTVMDDTTGPAAMTTLKNSLANESSPAVDDELFLYDLTATTVDKVTLQNLFNLLLGLNNTLTGNNIFSGAGNTFQSRINIASVVGGTVDAITMTFSPAFTALVDKMEFGGRATGANTSTTPTVNPDGLGALTIVKDSGVTLNAGDIAGSQHELQFRYNATSGKAVLLNPVPGQRATNGTPIVTTSGTSHDFPSIPDWVTEIVCTLYAVSTNGTSIPILQIGDSGGIETSGYIGITTEVGNGVATTAGSWSAGIKLAFDHGATVEFTGRVVLTRHVADGLTWLVSGVIADVTNTFVISLAGYKNVTERLDRVRLTTTNGTDAFDGGEFSILYR